jgi:hypothetical protein
MKHCIYFATFWLGIALSGTELAAATISTHPVSQQVVQGQPVALTVVASGSGSLSYQWQKDGVDIPGAISPTYEMAALKPWQLGSYRVRVTDGSGPVDSDPAVISLNTSSPTNLWDSLLLFLPFAGTTTDFSLSARTINQSNVGVGLAPGGGVAGAANFNGTSSRIDFTPNLPDLTHMSFSIWLKSTRAVGVGHIFVDWDDAASNDVAVILLDKKIGISSTKNGSTLSWLSGDLIEPEEWYHLVWVMEPTQSKIYLNGTLLQTLAQTGSNVGYKLRSNIGYFNYEGGKEFFQGLMSSLRIYGRALTGGDITSLYVLDAPQAEIIVKNQAGTSLTDGVASLTSEAAPVGGSSATQTLTITNIGTADLTSIVATKSGTNSADFGGSAPAVSLPVNGSTTITVTFSPASGSTGSRAANLHIASNDLDENPFDIGLGGQAFSTTQDGDSDGMNDWGEYNLAPLGFNWQVNNATLVATLTSKGSTAGFFTAGQIQDLNIGIPLLQRNPANGEFMITLGVEKSTALPSFHPFPMSVPQTLINGQGKLEFRFTVPEDAAFFRLKAE